MADKIIAKYNRLIEVFPDANVEDGTVSKMLEKYYKFDRIIKEKFVIIKMPLGSKSFFVYGNGDAVTGESKCVYLDSDCKDFEYICMVSIHKLISQYIETGRYDYEEVLTHHFNRIYNKTSIEIPLKKQFLREGRIKADETSEKYFKDYRVENGYYVI